jgi:hypothetical protein
VDPATIGVIRKFADELIDAELYHPAFERGAGFRAYPPMKPSDAAARATSAINFFIERSSKS